MRLYSPHIRHKNASQENKTPFQYLLKSFVYLLCCEEREKKTRPLRLLSVLIFFSVLFFVLTVSRLVGCRFFMCVWLVGQIGLKNILRYRNKA